jgi:hypothetical protein
MFPDAVIGLFQNFLTRNLDSLFFRGFKSQACLFGAFPFPIGIPALHRHAYADGLRSIGIDALDAGVNPDTFSELHHAAAIRFVPAVPFRSHGRRDNCNARERYEFPHALKFMPVHLGTAAPDANRPRRQEACAALTASGTHELLFVQETLKRNIVDRPDRHGFTSAQKS